jgi:hypothetical protein
VPVLQQWMWMLQLLRKRLLLKRLLLKRLLRKRLLWKRLLWKRLLWKRLRRRLRSNRGSLLRSNCMLIASLISRGSLLRSKCRRREAHCMQHIRERELIPFPKPVPLIEPSTEHTARQVAP